MKKTNSNLIDLTGQKFGRLTVLNYSHNNKNNHRCWKCICKCGKICFPSTSKLKSNHAVSCGCKYQEWLHRTKTTHGMSKTRFHRVWKSMIGRCHNKKDKKIYAYYGGRGINVCEYWKKFENFKDDMYQSYLNHSKQFTEKNTTLDRKDNNGNYHKENCKWSTRLEQATNRRTNHFIKYNGEKLTISQWGKKYNLSDAVIHSRIKCKWSMTKILTIPVRKKSKKL